MFVDQIVDWFLYDRELQWGESDETSRIFCGHVNFPEMNGTGISAYAPPPSQSRIIVKKGGGLVITNNTLQK